MGKRLRIRIPDFEMELYPDISDKDIDEYWLDLYEEKTTKFDCNYVIGNNI